jgi:hypothetical protein
LSYKIINPTTNPDRIGRGGMIIPGTPDGVIEFPTGGGTVALTSQLSQGGGNITQYTVTTASIENTTDEIVFASFTVPAGTWEDGEVVWVENWFSVKNADGTPQIQITLSTTGLTDIVESGFDPQGQETIATISPIFKRVGNDLYYIGGTDQSGILNSGFQYTNNVPAGAVSGLLKESNFDFDIPITISLSGSWDTADPDAYLRPFVSYGAKEPRYGFWK